MRQQLNLRSRRWLDRSVSVAIDQLYLARLAVVPVPREISLICWENSAPSASFAQSAATRSHASRSIGLEARSAFRRHSSASRRYLLASDIMGILHDLGVSLCAVHREGTPVAASHKYGRSSTRTVGWADLGLGRGQWSAKRTLAVAGGETICGHHCKRA